MPCQSWPNTCPLLGGSLPGTSDDLCSYATSRSSINSALAVARWISNRALASPLRDTVAPYKMNTGGVDGHDVGGGSSFGRCYSSLQNNDVGGGSAFGRGCSSLQNSKGIYVMIVTVMKVRLREVQLRGGFPMVSSPHPQ
jgi:hypothetical protein